MISRILMHSDIGLLKAFSRGFALCSMTLVDTFTAEKQIKGLCLQPCCPMPAQVEDCIRQT